MYVRIDNQNRVTGVTEDEAKATHAKGFRQMTGSILWPMRCTHYYSNEYKSIHTI